ncbi:hypothetical protein LhelvAHU1049_19100 [Lactobacillus helveticus]|nr:hypothetical protein LhelvAHU1049_19100 [Lactobacillus helveticus]
MTYIPTITTNSKINNPHHNLIMARNSARTIIATEMYGRSEKIVQKLSFT